jgi:hypothetical protein
MVYMWFRKETNYEPQLDDEFESIKREAAPDERTLRQHKIADFLSSFGSQLLQQGRIIELEIKQRTDTHAYYRLSDDDVLHVQGFPGLSTDETMMLNARVMDYARMQELRYEAANLGHDIAGNEHQAVRNAQEMHAVIPYDLSSLEGVLTAFSSDKIEGN